MKQRYVEKNFRQEALDLIYVMNEIVRKYIKQGYRMTVRQLYYQLVAGALIDNTEASYKRITSIVNDAKLAGLMDWEAIEDRTRAFVRRAKWNSPSDILATCAQGYHEDMWINQAVKIFVIVEKEALAGVLEPVCHELDIPLLAARGYPSGTVLREFAESDIIPTLTHGQTAVILHLGDHDPSGIDMTRDLEERISLFSGYDEPDFSLTFERIALNMDQIEEQHPPKNPAKSTDARFAQYRKKFGTSSWELDALKPEYLGNLIRNRFNDIVDPDAWEERASEIANAREKLKNISEDYDNL